jgi:hypothetical protein
MLEILVVWKPLDNHIEFEWNLNNVSNGPNEVSTIP